MEAEMSEREAEKRGRQRRVGGRLRWREEKGLRGIEMKEAKMGRECVRREKIIKYKIVMFNKSAIFTTFLQHFYNKS